MRTSTTVTLAIQILGLASLGMAADPIIGTWRLNLSQSKFSPAHSEMIDPRPKLHIETYREIEDRIEVSGTVTHLDGSSMSGKLSWPKQGGVMKFENAAVSDLSIVEALLAPGEWLAITMRDGRQVGTRRKVISKDGKTIEDRIRDVTAAMHQAELPEFSLVELVSQMLKKWGIVREPNENLAEATVGALPGT